MSDDIDGSGKKSKGLDALLEYRVLNSLPDNGLDSLTRLAACLCGTPMSIISFLDTDNQWVNSHIGFKTGRFPIADLLCQFIIQTSEILEIKDTLLNSKTSKLSIVENDPRIRFYAGVPIINSEGNVLDVLSVIDVSPRCLDDKQKEALRLMADEVLVHLEAIRQNRTLDELTLKYEEISTVFDNSAELHCIIDREGRIQKMNQVVESLLGYTVSEVQGRYIWEFFYEEDIKTILPFLEKGLSNGKKSFELECKVKLKDGSAKWMSWTIAVKNGKWFANGRDVTDKRRMIEELEQLSLVANKVNNGVIISDSNSQVIWINEASETITGYKLSDLRGHKLGDVLKGKDTDLEVINKARELTKNKQSFTVDLLAYKKDGTPIWLTVLNSAILDQEGNIYKEVEVIIDITARK